MDVSGGFQEYFPWFKKTKGSYTCFLVFQALDSVSKGGRFEQVQAMCDGERKSQQGLISRGRQKRKMEGNGSMMTLLDQ